MADVQWTDLGCLALLAMRETGRDWRFIGRAFGKPPAECRAVFDAVMADFNQSEGRAGNVVPLFA